MRATQLVFWSQALWLLTAVLPACGSDSGDTAAQAQQTCLNVCNKQKECTPSFPLVCSDVCNPKKGAGGSTSTGSTGTATCDYNELLKKENDCVSKSCSEFSSCLMDATAICSGSNGAGGSTGTGATNGTGASSSSTGGASDGSGGSDGNGASTGTGGTASSGTADCSVCDQAASCCMQANLGSSCSSFSKASCDMEGSSLKGTVAMACQQALDGFKSAGLCK